jgi:multidrug resistance efflux pump
MRATAGLFKSKYVRLEADLRHEREQVEELRAELAAAQEDIALYQEAELQQLAPLPP